MLIAQGNKIGKMRNFHGWQVCAPGEDNIKSTTTGQSNLYSPVHLRHFPSATLSLNVDWFLCRSRFCWKLPIPEVKKRRC